MRSSYSEGIIRGLLIVLVIFLAVAAAGCERRCDEAGGVEAEWQPQRATASIGDRVTLELIAVCGGETNGCWQPDGGESAEKMSVKGALQQAGEGYYSFVVKVTGPEDTDLRFYEIEGATRVDDSAVAVDSEGKEIEGVRAMIGYIEDGRSYTSLRLGAAAGEWETAAEYDGKGESKQIYGDIEFANLRQAEGRASISISDKGSGKCAYNFIAIDGEGERHAGGVDDSIPMMRPYYIKVDFHDVNATEIDKIIFQKRPFKEVRFSDISLVAGVRRAVVTEVDGVGVKGGKVKGPVESKTRQVGEKYVKTEKIEFGWPAGGRLVLNNDSGSIKVTGWGEDKCRVTATIEAGAREEDGAEEFLKKAGVQARLSYKKAVVEVIEEEREGQVGRGKFDFEIMVPKAADLELNTRQGSISIKGVNGEMECKTNDGIILMEGSGGNVRLRSNFGKVLVRGSEFENGVIRGNTADVDCNEVSGDINARVAAGEVKVRYAKDAPNVCDVLIMTTDGDISFTGPVGFSAAVEAQTLKGEIETDLPLTVKGKRRKTASGTIGGGEGRLKIKCTLGNIKIRENKP